jgi:hypothetical protein
MRQRYEDCGCKPKNVMVVSEEPKNEVTTVFVTASVTVTEKNCGKRGPDVSDMTIEMAADDDESKSIVERRITL